MPTRNRVIYQSEAIFASSTGVSTLTAASHGVRRVQSCNYNLAIQRQDINQFGELAAIDRLILQEPTVGVDLTYYFEPTGFNERHLGLHTNTYTLGAATGDSTVADHALVDIISGVGTFDQRNIFILTSAPGIDANDTGLSAMALQDASGFSSSYDGIIGIGNAFLTSWSLEASVGSIPTVSCAFEGQNIVFTGDLSTSLTPTGVPNPAIVDGNDPGSTVSIPSGAGLFDSALEIAAVRPGDVTLSLGSSGTDNKPMVGLTESDLKIQSATVAMSVNREPLRKLGKLFAFAREITFPVNCTMTVNAIVGASSSQKLFSLLSANGDAPKFNCVLTLIGYLSGSATAKTAAISLKGAKLNSQNITSSIGPGKAVTLEFSAQIGKNSGLHIYTG